MSRQVVHITNLEGGESLTLISERPKARMSSTQITGDYRNVHRQFQLEHRTGRLIFHYHQGGIVGCEFEKVNMALDKES